VSDMEIMHFADGKYTVLNKDGTLTALRYGEQWNRDLTGDNLVYWMFIAARDLKQDNWDLKVRVAQLEKQLESYDHRDNHSI